MSTSPITLYIPRDAAALSVGAERVVKAIQDEAKKRSVDVKIIRNGSRGMLWLEPLVEVATAKGRVAYGPVTPKDVASLFDAKFFEGGAHALGPAALIDGALVGRVDKDLLDSVCAERPHERMEG